MPPCPGVGKGAGPGGLWPPERRPGPAQREPRAGPRQGAAPTPPPGRWGGPRRGEVELGAGGARTQARPPTPRPGGRSQRPGHRHHGRAPRRGGCGPPHPGGQQRDRTQADHGPGAPPPATSPHQRRRGPTGRGRTRPGRCDLAAYLLCLPQRGKQRRRGESPEPGRRGGGPCARRPGGTGGGRYGQKQGPSLPVVGRRGGKKNAGRLAPPAGHDWTKKNAGRTLCPPRLPLQRIPDIPLFGVVVRNVLYAGQFHMLL